MNTTEYDKTEPKTGGILKISTAWIGSKEGSECSAMDFGGSFYGFSMTTCHNHTRKENKNLHYTTKQLDTKAEGQQEYIGIVLNKSSKPVAKKNILRTEVGK